MLDYPGGLRVITSVLVHEGEAEEAGGGDVRAEEETGGMPSRAGGHEPQDAAGLKTMGKQGSDSPLELS